MSDFDKFLAEQLQDPEFKAMWDAYESDKADRIYILARSIEPAVAYRLASKAASEEKRTFWTFIGDMNLQRAQVAAVKKNLF